MSNMPSIKAAGYSSIEACFKDVLSEAADLVEKEFDSLSEMEEWFAKQWTNYGDDITAFLEGLVSPEDSEESILITKVTIADMTDAIKANSESIFGFDITGYMEN